MPRRPLTRWIALSALILALLWITALRRNPHKTIQFKPPKQETAPKAFSNPFDHHQTEQQRLQAEQKAADAAEAAAARVEAEREKAAALVESSTSVDTDGPIRDEVTSVVSDATAAASATTTTTSTSSSSATEETERPIRDEVTSLTSQTTESSATSAVTSIPDDFLSSASSFATTVDATSDTATASPSVTAKLLADDPVVVADPNKVIKQAHWLKNADDFLPHFEAVRKLPTRNVASARRSCTWPDETLVNFQYGEEEDWVQQERSSTEIEQKVKEWHSFIANDMIPWSNVSDRFEGHGIVITAGNERSLTRLHVLLRVLSSLHCKLPVEIHYFKNEMSAQNRTDLERLYHDISFNDLDHPFNLMPTHANGYINYNLKTVAVLNSRFADVLLLDSDNIPVIEPSRLFSSRIYREYGSVFWPDIARTRPQNPMWAITNTPCRMDEYEQESGQLLVNKRRFFYHLQLAAWFNDHGYYNEFLLGDKDMFRFAWHALKTDYGRPRRWLTSIGAVHRSHEDAGKPVDAPGGFYCGHSFGQHYPDDERIAFMHGGLFKTISLPIFRHSHRHESGLFTAYQRSSTDDNPAANEPVGIRFDGQGYLEEDIDGKPDSSEMCTFMPEVRPRPLDELVPNAERLFRQAGGYWMLEEVDGPL